MNSEKPWYEKVNIILGIFASVCTITGISILDINANMNKPKAECDIENGSSEDVNNEFSEKIIVDVETEVKNIKTKYYSFQDKKGSPINYELNSQIKIYYDSNSRMLIQIQNGCDGINYSREYYFDENGKLYFAFIFNKRIENRLYFKDDILIRYINEDKETYDININLDTCEWEKLALTESYELFNRINQ